MAIVGSAHVVIRAITDKLQSDIQDGLKKSSPAFRDHGQQAGKAFQDGFKRGGSSGASFDGRDMFGGVEKEAGRSGDRTGRNFTQSTSRAIRRGAGSLESSSGGIGDRVGRAFSNGFGRSGASRTFISIGLRIAALVPILGGLVGAISNVVSGLFAIGAAATSAAQSLVVIPSLLGAIVQGAAVMMTGFSGIGGAISAGMKAADGAGSKAAAGMAKRAQSSGRAVERAAKGIKDAQEASAEGVRQAIRGVQDAEKSLADSQKNATKAQKELNDARKEAAERLIDLQFAQQDGALAERRASMELADARWQLNAASELPPDNRLRQEAQLAYDEAVQNLTELKERNGDNAEELKEVKKQGIDGMDEVVAAQENLKNAQDDVRDAIQGVADAERALAKARSDGADQVKAAREALADAKSSQAGLNQEMAAGGTAAMNYQDELNKLSPSARRFVEYIISIRGELKKLKTAAQDGMFPGLETAIRTLVSGLFPTLEKMMFRTGQAIGNAAKSISRDLTSGPFIGSFGRVTTQNAKTIERLGLVMGDLVRVIFAVLDAARPLTNQFTKWFVSWADGLRVTAETANSTGRMGLAFSRAGDRMKLIIGIGKDLIEGFYDIGKVAAPFGGILLSTFKESTEAFANFTDKVENRQALYKFFANTTDNFIKISSLIKEVGKAFFNLGSSPAIGKLAENLEPTVHKIEDLIKTMLDTNGTALVDFVNELIDTFAQLAEGGGLQTFLSTLTGFFGVLNDVLGAPILGPGIKMLLKLGAAMYAVSLIRKFPGISLLDKGLTSLFSKNKDGVRGFTTLKNGIKTAFSRTADVVSQTRAIAMNARAWAAVRIAQIRATATAKIQMAITKLQLIWGARATLAAKLYAGAMRLVGAATKLAFGPVGLIILGAIALFVLLYKKVDWFRNGVNKMVDGIVWVFGKIVDAAKWVYDVLFGHSIFPDMLKGFQVVFTAIGSVVKLYVGLVMVYVNLWIGFFKNVVAPVIVWLYQNVFSPIFSAIGRVVKFVWNNVVQPVFAAYKFYIMNILIPAIRFLWTKVISPVFGWIGGKIRSIWNNWVRPAFTAMKDFITNTLGPRISNFWTKVIRPVWDNIGGKIRAIWQNFISPAFSAIKRFIDNKLVPAFNAVKTGVVGMWNKIRDAAKAPIRFVINTIYNDGLRVALNKIPGVSLGKAAAGFAQGGVLPGYSPGKDIHQFVSPTAGRLALSGGEAIMRPEWTREVGGARGVKLMNAAARKGKGAIKKVMGYLAGQGDIGVDGSGYPAFASGGVLSAAQIKRGQDFMRAQLGKPYSMGGVGPGAYDCSGIVAAVENVIRGSNPYHRLGATSSFPWPGWSPGVGQFTVGSTPNYGGSGIGHMAGQLGSMKIESYGGHGPSISHRNYSDPNFTTVAHLGKAGKPGGPSPEEKKQKSWLSTITGVVSSIKSVAAKIKNMGNSDWMKLMKKTAKSVGNKAVSWVNNKIPNNIGPLPLPDNPIPRFFDSGGVATGKGWVAKNVAKPERMLSPRQTEAFDRLVDVLEKRGGADAGLNLTVQVPQDASARDVVDGIVYELGRQSRGGRYNR